VADLLTVPFKFDRSPCLTARDPVRPISELFMDAKSLLLSLTEVGPSGARHRVEPRAFRALIRPRARVPNMLAHSPTARP
jgi:hypothetical protein